MALIKCKECEKEISDEAKVCPHCGKINKNRKKNIKLILLIIGLIILVEFAKNIFTNNDESTQPPSYGNEAYNMTSYSNNVLQYGNWIIFSNGSTVLYSKSSNFNDGIYKYNIETGQVIELYDYNGYCLNLINDTLYFITTNNLVYKVNINTLEEKWLSNIEASYLLVYNDQIFYRDSNGNNIYKTNLERSTKELIAEYTDSVIQIDGDYIYYLDAQNFNLFKKNLKTQESTKIIEEFVSNFYVKDNKIIYIANGNLKILDCEQNVVEILKEGISSNFTFSNNNVYMYISDSNSIIELNIENKQEQIIKDNLEKIYRLQMYNDNIYYYYSTGTYPYMSTNLYKTNINNKDQEKIFFYTK